MSVTTNDNVKEFYAQDLVYKFDDRKRITFGIVTESYEGSDSDEYSGLQKGQILVSWNNSARKQICRQSKVHLMSRSIIPGDIVRRLEDGKETQRGYCKETKQFATVQIVESDKVIEHVSEKRLCFVKPFDIGDAVFIGKKVGRVQSIDHLIIMQSKCGSIVEVRSSLNYNIRDAWNHWNGGELGPSYIGQSVVCTPMHLKDPKWIKKSKAIKRKMEVGQTFTIQNIEICLVEVWWYTSTSHTEYAELKEDEIKKLKVLPYSETLMIGDRHVLKLRPTDILLKKREWIKKKSMQHLPTKVPQNEDSELCNSCSDLLEDEGWCTEEDEESDNNGDITKYKLTKIKARKKHGPRKLNKFSSGAIVAVEILCTDSKATVVWQDGTEEEDVPTTELYYSVSLDDHEFFPGEWVVPGNSESSADKFGVVQKVVFSERTAVIKWFKYAEAGKRPEELNTNEVSVYDLKKHAKYVFRPGSTVKSNPVQDDKMGRVVDSCPEGYVIVQWKDGPIENCLPQDIELIPESEDFDFPEEFGSDDDDLSDAYSWETESIESFDGDITDEITLQTLAAKVDFIRSRIINLREAFKEHNISRHFYYVKDLLSMYENVSYLDKYLATSYFSLESKHFQALLQEAKKKAKAQGIELRGRLFSKETATLHCSNLKSAEKESIQKIMKLESKVNAEIESSKECSFSESSCEHSSVVEQVEPTAKPTDVATIGPATPESLEPENKPQDNLCVELALMLKMRLDLVYAEIISRIGGRQALTVLTNLAENNSIKPSPSSAALHKSLITPEELPLLTPPKLNKPIELTPNSDSFCILDEVSESHHYYSSKFEPKDLQKFLNTLQKEYTLLKESLPPGVWVRVYDNRMDLLSVMIRGPAKTPYEDGLFLFDIQLAADYPRSPPLVYYISYIEEALNPNLYVEGKVCVSLLGTWMGRGSEVWGSNSTLLQLIVSIQGLILVAEPYYNEAGYERQTHTQQGYENSRTYNEYVLLKLVQSMTELLNATPTVFQNEILTHFKENGETMCQRSLQFCHDENPLKPDFPLLPVSKGLKLSLKSAVNTFKHTLKKILDKVAHDETVKKSDEV